MKNKVLLKAIPDMIFVQNHKGDYLECFAQEPEKLFMPPEEFIGKNMKAVLPPPVFSVVKNALDLAVRDKHIQLGEYSVAGKNGGLFYEVRVVPMNEHAVLTIVRDVTEEKLREQQLQESANPTDTLHKVIFPCAFYFPLCFILLFHLMISYQITDKNPMPIGTRI